MSDTAASQKDPAAIIELLADYYPRLAPLEKFYQWMHANPELSTLEEETAAAIIKQVSPLADVLHTGVGGHGVIAQINNGDGPVVLMRADFDGLPVEETTGVSFASTKRQVGPDGVEVPTMHACGHDMHTTALIALLQLLHAARSQWKGTFIALFQPAEETASGALAMVDDRLAELIPTPDVCFGQHIVPGPAGTVYSMPGAALAACDTITITLYGRSAHGSMPHLSIDPSFLAAMIVVRLQGIVGREVSPFDFAVVTVGSLIAGHTHNTIPEEATLVFNCRFYNDEVKQRTYEAIERVVRAEALASGCEKEPTFEYSFHGELTDNDAAVFDRVRPAFDAVLGKRSVDATPWTASEDFSFIPRAFGVPYLFWTVGMTPAAQWEAAAAGNGQVPGNHMGTFLPDFKPTFDSCLRAAATAVLSYLG